MKLLTIAAALMTVAACKSSSQSGGGGGSAAAASAPLGELPGTKDVALPGDANGLYWDAKDHALYLTDAANDALDKWTPAGGVAQVAKLPPAAKVDFGGIARLADGTVAIASFGFGTDGGVIVVAPDGTASTVPNLDPARRRIGLAVAPDGAIYEAYFTATGHQHSGGVAKVDLKTGETDVVTQGLQKPVGIAATAAGVFVADQDQRAVYRVDGAAVKPVAADLPSVDLMTALPDGSLVTGGKSGTITRITSTGAVTPLAGGLGEVRGLAYDADAKQLFVVVHDHDQTRHVMKVMPYAPAP